MPPIFRRLVVKRCTETLERLHRVPASSSAEFVMRIVRRQHLPHNKWLLLAQMCPSQSPFVHVCTWSSFPVVVVVLVVVVVVAAVIVTVIQASTSTNIAYEYFECSDVTVVPNAAQMTVYGPRRVMSCGEVQRCLRRKWTNSCCLDLNK